MLVARANGLPPLVFATSVEQRLRFKHPTVRRNRKQTSQKQRQRCCAADSDIDEDPLGQFCPVPLDQQPIHELKELQGILFFDWATLPFPEFMKKLAYLWAGFCIISFPVSAATFDPNLEPIPFFVAGSCGSLFVVMIVVFRLFLGWSHVGQRLVSETVEYEESGWLASSFTVKPAMERLQTTLVTVSGSFVTSLILLSFIAPSQPLPPETRHGMYTRAQPEGEDDYWMRVRKFEPWLFEDTANDE